MKKKKTFLFSLILGIFLTALWGLGQGEPAAHDNRKQIEVLKIGLMPAVDTAPIYLAQEKAYFLEEGIDLEIILFTNAQDRQSALQAGAIDGAMTDLVALAVNRSSGFPIKATTLTDGMFPILAGEGRKDKRSVSIGLMEISVSNFLVDEWMSADYELNKVYINAIPARLEAVASGQLDMGIFPEPIASMGTMRGLEKIIFKSVDGYCPDVMVFTEKALARDEALGAFHRAYNRAVRDIQADEGLARDTLMRNIPDLMPELRDLMVLPRYHQARLPDAAFLTKIIDWTNSITAQDLHINGEDMLDRRFIAP